MPLELQKHWLGFTREVCDTLCSQWRNIQGVGFMAPCWPARKTNTKSSGLLRCAGERVQEEAWMAQEGNQFYSETRYLFRTLRPSSSCRRWDGGGDIAEKLRGRQEVWKPGVITGLNSPSKRMQYCISFLLTLSGLYWTRKSYSLNLMGKHLKIKLVSKNIIKCLLPCMGRALCIPVQPSGQRIMIWWNLKRYHLRTLF